MKENSLKTMSVIQIIVLSLLVEQQKTACSQQIKIESKGRAKKHNNSLSRGKKSLYIIFFVYFIT
jgi:hypothetical protein